MLRILSLLVLALTLFIATGCDNGGSDNNFGGSSSTTVIIPDSGPGGVNGTAFITTPSGVAAEAITTLPYTFTVTVTGVTSVGGRFSATLDTSTGTANFDGLFVSFSALTPIAPGVFQSTGTVSGGFTGFGTVTMTVTYREDELEIIETFLITVIDPGPCTAAIAFSPTSPATAFAGGADLSVTVTPTPAGGTLSIVPSSGFSLVGTTLTFAASGASVGTFGVTVNYDASAVNPFCTVVSQTFTVNVLPTSFTSGIVSLPILDDTTPGTSSIITVPAGAPTVTDTRVFVDISHGYIGDLEVTLLSPTGTLVFLADNNGGSNVDMAVVFDDNDPNGLDVTSTALGGFLGSAAPGRVPSLSYLTSDSIGGVTSLNAFNTQAMSGDWTLEVTDNLLGSAGTLNEWAIAFNGDLTDIPAPSTLAFDTLSPIALSSCDPVGTLVTGCIVSPAGGSFSIGVESNTSGATYSIDALGNLTCDTSAASTSGTDFVEVIYTPPVGLPSLGVFEITFTFATPLNSGVGLPSVTGSNTCAAAPTILAGQLGSGTTVGSTVSAEGGACSGLSRGTGGDVFFLYTPSSCATSVTVDLSGSAYDTKLHIYTTASGCVVGLPCVVADDDSGTGLQSLATFVPTPGTTYFIVVNGFGAATGVYTMSITES